MLKYILPALAIILTFTACSDDDDTMQPQQRNPFIIEPGTRPQVIAHRGGRRLRPENTLVAFNHAVNLGVEVLEMDVVLTKDTVLVTIHDLTIDRTCDSSGNVSDFTFDELQQFNFGYEFEDGNGNYPFRNDPVRIPAFTEVLQAHPNMLLNIEIKDQGDRGKLAAEKVVEAINTYHTPKMTVVYSFSDEVAQYMRSINTGGFYTGIALGEGLAFYNAVIANTDDTLTIAADVFAIPVSQGPFVFNVDSLVESAHSRGKAVDYWTINDTSEMRELILLGADGLITDYPDRMQDLLIEMGY